MSYAEPTVESVSSEARSFQVIAPKGRADAFVDSDFRKAVLVHITKNHLDNLNPALMLAIQGVPGEGKSFQARAVCSEVGAYVVPLSGAMLAGSFEGEAVAVFQDAYRYASAVRATRMKMTVLLVDDFDLSVAAILEDRRYTVNTQLLAGFLMSLADDPRTCGGKPTHRVPILLTGNNFTALHGPLTRHGRMNFFDWSPSFEQKLDVVRHIFSDVLRREDLGSVAKLVNKFRDRPVSFFASLREDLVDEAIHEVYTRAQSLTDYQEAALAALRDQSLDRILALGSARDKKTAKDYLRKEFWKG